MEADSEDNGSRESIVCLLPVRNGGLHLDRWLASVRRFADSVIALDDGSTDDTHDRLAASPLVAEILRNPRRSSFVGWNDAENRQRLLDAAAAHRPRWITQLDVDEEISDDDAAALRVFARDERDHGVDALSFPVHRMIGEDGRWDRIDNTPMRMFRWAPGQRLPDDRLHLAQVPISIPESRRGASTVRIRHFSGVDEQHRQARYDKYSQVDPGRAWQRSYEHLLDTPGGLREWAPRPPSLPVVANYHCEADTTDRTVGIDVSLIVNSSVGRTVAGDAADVVTEQIGIRRPPSDDGLAEVVASAVGEVVMVVSDDDDFRGRGLAERLAAHRSGWAIVTGTIVNTNTTRYGWADYFVDHNQELPGRPSAPLTHAPQIGSFRRDALAWLVQVDAALPHGDASAAERLYAAGFGAYREQRVTLRSGSESRSLSAFVRFHYRRRREPSDDIIELRHRREVGELRRREVARSFLARSRRHLRDLVTGLREWGSPADRRLAAVVAPLIALAYAAELVGSVIAYCRLEADPGVAPPDGSGPR